jgi:FdhD protein
MKCTETVEIIKVSNGVHEKVIDEIVLEEIIYILVNRRFYASLLCTPNEKMELAVGSLYAQRVILSMEDMKSVEDLGGNIICVRLNHDLQEDFQKRKVLTSGCAQGSIDLSILEEPEAESVKSNCKYSASNILTIMKEFNNKSEVFKQTGGVHSCAICSSEGIIFFSDDIGRHNALDKVIGRSLINKLELGNKLLMTTGRISSDIAVKAARAGIPLIVSHSAPTAMALNIAKSANITMIGFTRGNRMSIYCGEERIDI